jgi:hypothetical protein
MKNQLPKHVQDAIRERLRQKQHRERQQKELLSKEDLWHDQIADKLASLELPTWEVRKKNPLTEEQKANKIAAGETFDEEESYHLKYPWLENFYRCGTESIIRQCCCCGTRQEFKIQCSQKFCPRCQWKLTKKRVELMTAWSQRIKNPQHIVLTQKNFPTLTRKKLAEHVKNIAKIRRKKVFKNVRGGTTSVEITNEGNGWHLHSHWLVDAGVVDPSELAISWGKLVNQEYAIVKVKPVTSREYISECAKYVAKGNDIARWPVEHIWEFLLAIRGRRFFFSFGDLSKLAPEVKEQIRFQRPEKKGCECGSHDFKFRVPSIMDKEGISTV